MGSKRHELGPHTVRDGAIVKLTTTVTPRERCFMSCYTTPKHIITYFGRKVWVCNRHRGNDGIG